MSRGAIAQIWVILLIGMIASHAQGVEFRGSKLVLDDYTEYYTAPKDDQVTYQWSTVQTYLDSQLPVETVSFDQPDYWIKLRSVVNETASPYVVMVARGSIIDDVQVHVYRDGELSGYQANGYLYHREELSYALDLKLEPGVPYDFIISIQSRYLTGPIHIDLQDPETYYHQDGLERAIVYVCLGALLVLGLYNFVLFIGIREVSYLYYALYLFSGIVGWAAIFNVLVNYFDIYALGWNLIPFYLTAVFNSLFLLSFLRIRIDTHPLIFYVVTLLMLINALMVAGFLITTNYLGYYSLIIYNSTLWIFMSLWAGVVRWREGYRPARFFIMGFVVLALGGSVSILPGLGIQSPFDNFYIFTLMAQTIDMTLLALALADKIALMRVEKQEALTLAHAKDVEMLKVEKQSNQTLQDSNEKLKHAVALHEESDRKRKNFLMLVNHELRTPVNAMMESISQLDHKIQTVGQQKSEELSHIRYGAESLSLLLDELSVFSELSYRHVKPVISMVNVNSLMAKMLEIGQTLVDEKDVKVTSSGKLASNVLMDAFLLEAVLKPIMNNACKFTEQGEVSFHINYLENEQLLQVCIEDSGLGIRQEDVQPLLDAFEQSTEGFDREESGLGLGLFIASTAIKALNGSLSFGQSERLGGASVLLTIPCETVDAAPLNHKIIQNALIVEDNLVNAKVLSSIMTSLGVEVFVAANGKEALIAADSTDFDLILMDLQMPVMDGFEATEKLKQRQYPAPILAVTANSEQDARHRCLALGMADVLIKPVRKQDVQTAIEGIGGHLAEPKA